MKARPTEYKGVLYESKCEAMFARWLELDIEETLFIADQRWPWLRVLEGSSYHPPIKGVDLDGWLPDFLRWRVFGYTNQAFVTFETVNTYIEYKPSQPTDTYAKEFAGRCQRIYERFSDRLESVQLCFELFYGSVFGNDRNVLEVNFGCEDGLDGVIMPQDYDWLINYEEAIRETRFDLVNA